MDTKKTLQIFMQPQEFPCGEQSSCCGPTGQSAEQIQSLKGSIEKELGYEVEVLNVKSDDDMRDHPQVMQLVHSMGPAALPILALGDEIVSMGNATPEKAVATIRENTEKTKSGKEDKMIENDNSEPARTQESGSTMQPCCSSASDSSCCPSGADGGSGKGWKMLIFILILIAAGGVLAHSLMNKSNSTEEPFATMPPESIANTASLLDIPATGETTAGSESKIGIPAGASVMKETEVPDEPASTLLFKPLDSLASLNKAAADLNAVFIFLGADNQEDNQPVTKEIESAVRKVQADGSRVGAFTLNKDAPNYTRFAQQFSIPCVLATVKGAGMSVVSGKITETKLIQAFVAASRPRSGCGPGGCGPGGTCGPRPAKPGTK